MVIAWNGGREALRAVHDAMPFLQRAEKVTIFAFSSGPSSLRASAEMLVTHLASHGRSTPPYPTGQIQETFRQSKPCSRAWTLRMLTCLSPERLVIRGYGKIYSVA